MSRQSCRLKVASCRFQFARKASQPAIFNLQLATVLAVLTLMLFLPLAGLAQNPASAFDAANKLYEQGKYTEAVGVYEKLVQSGQASAAVYFNLGNSFFKSGQIGQAVAAYRQAEQITPRDPDVRANLQFARNQAQGPSLSASRWEQWLSKLTLNEWTLLTTGAGWLLLLLLVSLQWRPALGPTLRGYLIVLVIAIGVSCCCLAAALHERRFTRTAIVITRDAPAHHGPLDESQNAFVAHDGAELRVLDQKDQWLQVSAGPGRIGWLRRDQVILPPAI